MTEIFKPYEWYAIRTPHTRMYSVHQGKKLKPQEGLWFLDLTNPEEGWFALERVNAWVRNYSDARS